MSNSSVELQEYLLGDGAPRDLEFEGVTWAGVSNLIAELRREFPEVAVGATSLDTEDVQIVDPHAAVGSIEVRPGSTQLVFNGGAECATHLQLFVSSDGISAPSVEITFFPPDLLAGPDLVSSFKKWVRRLRESLGASRVYARENPSLEL